MRVLAGALVLTLAATAYVLYRCMDAGISLDHSRMQATFLRERASLSLDLLNAGWKDRSERQVEQVARRIAARDQVVFKHDGTAVLLGDIRFELADGKVTSVSYSSEPAAR